jgi:hypothetical protein
LIYGFERITDKQSDLLLPALVASDINSMATWPIATTATTSPSNPATGPGTTGCCQPSRPALYVGAEPKLRPASTKIDDGYGHIGVSPLVCADRLAERQTENPGDTVGVNQVFRIYVRTHAYEATPAIGSVRARL